MLFDVLFELVGEPDVCVCRLAELGELDKWSRFWVMYEIAVEAMS